MKLRRFRVRNFRSVSDSGWIEIDGVTALIGVNESGKTNLLLPLWKLNPASEGEINVTADYPRKRLSEFRRLEPQPVFVEAEFQGDDDLVRQLAELTGRSHEQVRQICVSRDFEGRHHVSFPSLQLAPPAPAPAIDTPNGSGEAARKADGPPASLPMDAPEVVRLVLAALPRFVYYANYGNLDSEIYLPHVIENMARTNLGAKERAKARTLRVLFQFVGLSPEEILELGRGTAREALPLAEPAQSENAEALAQKKKLRSILLQSAGSHLSDKFRERWKQGAYRFRFEADGDHFRIWVSDDQRPEEIELEARSSGLQWFLSFYLVFLVESQAGHAGAILLLDEPGLSLHPLAQKDLSLLLDGLAESNQLIYTTHSPFLVDADHLERVRRVYVEHDGSTRASAELRAADAHAGQLGSGYAVRAALNLAVAESLLVGCEPVIVESAWDQQYLTAIKAVLSSAGRLRAGRDIVFSPSGSEKGVRPVASLLLGRDQTLPVAFVDSDAAGRRLAQALRAGMYSESPHRVVQVGDFVNTAEAEVEDLIPKELLVRELDRWQRVAEVPFADVVRDRQALVPQIEQWALSQGVELPRGWRTELAKRVTRALLAKNHENLPAGTVDLWQRVFKRFAIDTPAAVVPPDRISGGIASAAIPLVVDHSVSSPGAR
jgi:energy-coupling factor transporter ATP-binding protein EcfA2